MALAIKIVVAITTLAAFIMFIVGTSTDEWQKTVYRGYRTGYSHSGLWTGCYQVDDMDRKICSHIEKEEAWLRATRAFLALSIVSLLVVVSYIIATFVRYDLVFRFAGVLNVIAAVFAIIALAIYTAKSKVPEEKSTYIRRFGWSLIVAWAAWVLTVISSILAFLVPDNQEGSK